VTESSPDPAPGGGRLRRLLAAVTIDIGPLRRSRDYRLLFAGQLVSFFGSMLTYVALPYQVYTLTRSSLAVGLLGLAELGPLLLTAFVGGALADAVDRRRMVQATELALALGSGALALNATAAHPRLWVLYAVAGGMAALNGLQRPSLEAMVPRIVDREDLPAASALGSLKANVGMIAGPAAAGALLAGAGLTATYAIDVATFMVSLGALASMRAVPPPPDAGGASLRGVLDGLRYARSRPELIGTYVVDIVAMTFGMPIALFPAMAEGLGGAGALGLLYAAPSVGALAATLTSGWTKRVHRHGAAVLVAAGVWGLGVAAFGVSRSLPFALFFLALAGAADMLSGLFRMTIWNQTIPDHLRGRLASIELLSYSTGPLLGNTESGLAAALVGVRASVVSGGALCVVGVIACAALLPGFRRYDARAR
jgi:MFS family permease